jgi:hypothetical protein
MFLLQRGSKKCDGKSLELAAIEQKKNKKKIKEYDILNLRTP